MDSFKQLTTAINYSFHSMTWVTWLVLLILGIRAVQAFSKAYKEYDKYKEMIAKQDRMAIINFYTGIFLSLLCLVVFFLPYFMTYEG